MLLTLKTFLNLLTITVYVTLANENPEKCGISSYFDHVSGICKLCNQRCKICVNQSTCIICNSGYFFEQQTASCSLCSENCEICSDMEICKKCKSSYKLVNEICFKITKQYSSFEKPLRKLNSLDNNTEENSFQQSSNENQSKYYWIIYLGIGITTICCFGLCYICRKHKRNIQQKLKASQSNPPQIVLISNQLQPQSFYQIDKPISFVPNFLVGTNTAIQGDSNYLGIYSQAAIAQDQNTLTNPAAKNPSLHIPSINIISINNLSPNIEFAPKAQFPFDISNETSIINSLVINLEDEFKLCIICHSVPKDAVFIKCGHVLCCEGCGKRLLETNPECPSCKSAIIDVIKYFI